GGEQFNCSGISAEPAPSVESPSHGRSLVAAGVASMAQKVVVNARPDRLRILSPSRGQAEQQAGSSRARALAYSGNEVGDGRVVGLESIDAADEFSRHLR